MRIAIRHAAAVSVFLACAHLAVAEWRSLATDPFVVFYQTGPGLPSAETMARRVLGELEDAAERVRSLAGGWWRGRLPVVLQDLGAYTNGLADPVFRSIHAYPYEPAAWSELSYTQDPLRTLVVHELTHMSQLVLGAGILSPSWLAEGLAVYVESASSPYEGRLNDGAYDALVGVTAREVGLPTLARATFSEETYPYGSGPYVWGAGFVRYLAGLKGEQALSAFLEGYATSALSYLSPILPLAGLDRMARLTWGKSLPALWNDWRATYETAPAPPRRRPDTVVSGLVGLERADGHLYYARSLTAKTAPGRYRRVWQVVRRNPAGDLAVILSTPSAIVAPVRVSDGFLYYAVAEMEGAHPNTVLSGYGYTAVLRRRSLLDRGDLVLARAPLRCFAVLATGDVLYAVDDPRGEGSELWLARAGVEPRRVRTLDLRVVELAANAEHLVLGARTTGTNEDLYTLDQEALATAEPVPLVVTPWAERTPSITGDLVLYSANPQAVARIRGVDLATGEHREYDTGKHALWPVLDPEASAPSYVTPSATGPVVALAEVVPAALEVPGGKEIPTRRVAPVVADARPGGWGPNLLTLAPRIAPLVATDFRYFRAGVLLMGHSAIGDLDYRLRGLYDFTTREPTVEASLVFRPVFPMEAGLDYSSAGHALVGTVGLIPWRGLQSGLSWVRLSLTAEARAVFTAFTLTPSIGAGLRFPWVDIGLRVRVPLQSRWLGSSGHRVGVHVTLNLDAALLGGELGLEIRAGWDPRISGSVLPPIRGHASSPEGAAAASARMEYRHSLIRIRNGLWNPAVYLGDLVAGVFAQTALSVTQAQAAAGVSLAVETRVFAVATGLPIVAEAWVGVSEILAPIWGGNVSVSLPIDL